MSIDPGVERGLREALGHAAPFAAAELATLRGPLCVRGARQLAALVDCAALEELTLFACAIEDADVFARLGRLRRLRILCSTINDVAPLAAPPLELLELNFSVVHDAKPLLASRSLRVLRAYGVPWDVASFDVTMLEWRLGDHGHDPAPAIELSRRKEWRATRALFEAGVNACVASLPGSWTALVRPGVHDGDDLCEGYPEQMVPALTEHRPSSWADATASGFRTSTLSAASPERFSCGWESGTDVDARRWLDDASLGSDDKAALNRFVGRFSAETFWRESATMQAAAEKRIGTRLPPRLAQLRAQALAGVRPDEPYLRMCLDAFDYETPHGQGDGWYVVGLLGYGNDERRALLLDELGLFPIADSVVESGLSELAMNARDSDDPVVYEYRTQELFHARSEGKAMRELARPAFASVASLLGHVSAYQIDDELIKAE